MPLAINAMAQPTGRVCGFDQRYRFYLRSSPIVCAADLASFIIDIIALSRHHRSIRRGLKQAMRVRKLHVKSDAVGAQAIEKLPLQRFIVFVLAASQAVKLFSCKGIPWTQTWAYSYFLPYCFYEVLGITRKWIERGREGAPEATPRDGQLKKDLRTLTGRIGLLAVAAQGILIFILFLRSLKPSEPGKLPFLGLFITFSVSLLFIAYPAILIITRWKDRSLLPHQGEVIEYKFPVFKLFLVFITALPLQLTSYLYMDKIPRWVAQLLRSVAGPVILSVLLLLALIFCEIAVNGSGFARIEVFLVPTSQDARRMVKYGAVLNFLLFLFLSIFSVLGYAFEFNSSGTFKPDWANRFG